MRIFVITTFIGTFGVDENNKILHFERFEKTPTKMAEKLKLSELEVIDEERAVKRELGKKGYREFIFPFRKPGVKHFEQASKAETHLRENLRKLAVDYKVVKDQTEFNKLLTQVNLESTKVKIKKAIERDRLIIQTNGAIEELDKSSNILIERLREWYGLHFPEMDRIVSSHEKYASLIEKFGQREKIDEVELSQFRGKSMGMDLNEDDIKTIQEFAKKILEIYNLREDLAKYLDKLSKEVAPNLRELIGPMLTAKLIAKAGGLNRLASSPSSTIQLLGAEKALFRFLHGRGKSPKFGILFNHPMIQNAPKEHKGKIARTLAAKISIAAKMDYYSKKYRGDKLKKDLEERVKKIMSSK